MQLYRITDNNRVSPLTMEEILLNANNEEALVFSFNAYQLNSNKQIDKHKFILDLQNSCVLAGLSEIGEREENTGTPFELDEDKAKLLDAFLLWRIGKAEGKNFPHHFVKCLNEIKTNIDKILGAQQSFKKQSSPYSGVNFTPSPELFAASQKLPKQNAGLGLLPRPKSRSGVTPKALSPEEMRKLQLEMLSEQIEYTKKDLESPSAKRDPFGQQLTEQVLAGMQRKLKDIQRTKSSYLS